MLRVKKGPKQKGKDNKGKGKEVAAKTEEKDNETDGVWMVAASSEGEDGIYGDDESQGEMWTEDKIFTESDIWVEDIHQDSKVHSPNIMTSETDDILTEFIGLDDSSVTDNAELDLASYLDDLLDLTAVDSVAASSNLHFQRCSHIFSDKPLNLMIFNT